MKRHTVRQGENIHSIAQKYSTEARKIWENRFNRHLREGRRDHNCLLPGDVVCIPENEDWFTGLSTGQIHYFKVKMPEPASLKVQFRHNGKILANCNYELKYGDHTMSGLTDRNGRIEATLPVEVTEAVVNFPEHNRSFRLGLRHLNPVETDSGIQSRLRALGHYFAKVDGIKGKKHAAALHRYKKRHGIESNDEHVVTEHIYGYYDQLREKQMPES